MNGGHILRRPVVAAMIRTIRKNAADAIEFWSQVRDGELLKRTDPSFQLRQFLLNSSLSTRALRAGQKMTSEREMETKSIIAWNAYRQKRNLSTLKWVADAKMPKVR